VTGMTFISLVIASALFAQEPLVEDLGAAGLGQTLRKLATNVRVMHIAAHPDDEDSGTLTWLSRGEGAHVVLLSLNRGEAGANLVSNDFFDRLGALRTVEFLRACQYYGAAGLRFTKVIDYGYSKNLAETFRNWNREDVLRDVVRVIREEQPHILLSRFQGSARDGHGNHEAAGVMAQLAFEAAGDPKRFPEQIAAGLKEWQPQKLYISQRGGNEGYTVRVDSGAFDPLLGKSYAQMGRMGYRQHRSQAAGAPIPAAGPVYSYWKLSASKVGMAEKEGHFFDRIAGAKGKVVRDGELPAILAEVRRMPAGKAREVREAQVQAGIAQWKGLQFTALVDPDQAVTGPASFFRAWESFHYATPGQKFTVTAAVCCGVEAKVQLMAAEGWQVRRLEGNRFEVTVPENAATTAAYWSRGSVWQTSYNISNDKWFGLPLTPSPLRARAVYQVDGVEASLERDVEISYLDQLGVQFRRSLAVAPPVALRFTTEAGYLPLRASSYGLAVAVRNHRNGPVKGEVRVELPAGWSSVPEAAPFAIEKEEEEVSQRFELRPPAGVAEGAYEARVLAKVDGKEWSSTFLPISQPGLASVALSGPARHEVRVVDVQIAPGLRTAYIPGTGDDVPEAMRQLGAAPDILDSSALAAGDLSKYHTILLGIRAYAARKDVKTFNNRLLEYVKNGGVLIVQYNTQEYDNNYGPYPYSQTARAEEVSEEDSPVTILDVEDAAFRYPNKITTKDFEGWVEQRGSKFFTTWDARWKPLIETHDTGQAPQKGIWLAAKHGKGLYVYCALAWYRQLPFAVPGAARIFGNLISLGAADSPWR